MDGTTFLKTARAVTSAGALAVLLICAQCSGPAPVAAIVWRFS
jgi:hypothetical protein